MNECLVDWNFQVHTSKLQLLTKVREEVQQVTHLNNQEKNEQLSSKDVRWEDILNKAEELCQSMTVEGNIRWPPACNISNAQTPPKGCRAHPTQHQNNQNGESSHNNNGQQKKPFFKKKFTKQLKMSWKNEHPKKNQLKRRQMQGAPAAG